MRGLCFRCGREVGGFLRPQAWQCVRCRRIFCEGCAKERVGLIFKKPVCPECRIELKARALPFPNLLNLGLLELT